MTESQDSNTSQNLSLVDIDLKRDPEERTRSGKSGEIEYQLEYDRQDDVKTVEGKVIEISTLADSDHMDLQPLSQEGYTHYGIFRLEDRSTTTLIQDEDGNVYKVFSFSRNNVKVSHPVEIRISADK